MSPELRTLGCMKITHLGHSCLLLEHDGARLLIDPGVFSRVDEVSDVDAIVVTHQHPDHLDPEALPGLLQRSPNAQLRTDPETAAQLAEKGIDATVNETGNDFEVGAFHVTPIGKMHAEILPYIPRVTNVGVLVKAEGAPSLFHPGDSLEGQPLADVDLLAVPIAAPWSALKETVAFVRRIHPDRIIPIHDAITSEAGRGIYLRQTREHGLDGGVEVLDLRDAGPTEVS